jgi:hypothetical protein
VQVITKPQADNAVARFKQATSPQDKLAAIIPLTIGLGDDTLAKNSYAMLNKQGLPDGVDRALEAVQEGDGDRAATIISALSSKGTKGDLPDARRKELNAAIEAGVTTGETGANAMLGGMSGNLEYTNRANSDAALIEKIATQIALTTDGKSAYNQAKRIVEGDKKFIQDPHFGVVQLKPDDDAGLVKTGLTKIKSGLPTSALGPQIVDTLANNMPKGRPPDLSDKFNTPLNAREEANFQDWLKDFSRQKGYDARKDLADYDLRGMFKSGEALSENGHGSDKWKKPNHPTFSDESVYSGGDNGVGGKWVDKGDGKYIFQASDANLKYRNGADLKTYFQNNEKGNDVLITPTTDPIAKHGATDLLETYSREGSWVNSGDGFGLLVSIPQYSKTGDVVGSKKMLLPGPDGKPMIFTREQMQDAATPKPDEHLQQDYQGETRGLSGGAGNDRLAGVADTSGATAIGGNPANSVPELARRVMGNVTGKASADIPVTAEEAAALGIPSKGAEKQKALANTATSEQDQQWAAYYDGLQALALNTKALKAFGVKIDPNKRSDNVVNIKGVTSYINKMDTIDAAKEGLKHLYPKVTQETLNKYEAFWREQGGSEEKALAIAKESLLNNVRFKLFGKDEPGLMERPAGMTLGAKLLPKG